MPQSRLDGARSAKAKKSALAAGLAAAIALVATFEGLRNEAYVDPVGIPTICYGYTHGVELGQVKTTGECEGLLAEEVLAANRSVDRCVRVPISSGERSAYASFVYNVGGGAFCSSSLVRKLNAGDRRGACRELDRWVMARGKKLPGLVRRRAAERALCESELQAGGAA